MKGESVHGQHVIVDAGMQALDATALFATTHDNDIVRLRQLLAAGEPDQPRLLVHTLKGAAGNLGATRIQQLSGELEQNLRTAGAPDAIERLVDTLDAELRDFCAAVLAMVPDPATHAAAADMTREFFLASNRYQRDASAPPPATVLIVDDDPGNLGALSRLLHSNYDVRAAQSGRRALELIASAPPDLILMDVLMPAMNGYDVLKQLKANPATAGIPVIFLSGMDGSEDIRKGMEMGAKDFIAKPYEPEILLEQVARHIAPAGWR